MKKKLAFIDYWHHKYTRSGDFLREEFSKEFEITDFWWSKNTPIPINELKKFDNIFFFQIIYPYRIIKKIGCSNILWAPMYDGLIFRNNFFKWIFWKQIFDNDIKVLNFAKILKKFCENNHIEHMQVQYFNEPLKEDDKVNYPLNVLFWDRGDVKISDWIDMFDPKDLNKIFYIKTPDPGKKREDLEEKYLKKFNIKIIDREFKSNKNEFLDYLKKSEIFIAPRKKEGIGLPTIEAISYGKYIVGFNDSTMNEYIVDKRIGTFISKDNKKIDIDNVLSNKKFRLNHAKSKYDLWIDQKNQLNNFLLKKKNKKSKNILYKIIFFIDDLKELVKTILKKNIYKY